MIETAHRIRQKLTWVLGSSDPSMPVNFWVWPTHNFWDNSPKIFNCTWQPTSLQKKI